MRLRNVACLMLLVIFMQQCALDAAFDGWMFRPCGAISMHLRGGSTDAVSKPKSVQQIIAEHHVVLLMKGSPSIPMSRKCAEIVMLVRDAGLHFEYVDVLQDHIDANAWPGVPLVRTDPFSISILMAQPAHAINLPALLFSHYT